MIIVHVEVVTLEGIAIHTSVDRPEICIARGIIFVKIDHHFVGSDMDRVENDVIFIGSSFDTRHIDTVVVTTVGHLTMEEESQWSLAPGEIRVLASV